MRTLKSYATNIMFKTSRERRMKANDGSSIELMPLYSIMSDVQYNQLIWIE